MGDVPFADFLFASIPLPKYVRDRNQKIYYKTQIIIELRNIPGESFDDHYFIKTISESQPILLDDV